MDPETPFRIALALVLIATMSVTVFHRLRAASTGEKISHRDEGYLFAAVLRLVGVSLWIEMFMYLLCPTWIAGARMPLPAWARWCGVAVGALTPLLMFWTLRHLGKNLTDTVVTRTSATLVTSGPYRWVRHPFYISATFFLTSAALISANALIALSSALVLLMLAIRTPKEERRLIDRFGDDYRQYMVRTGRFFPRIGS